LVFPPFARKGNRRLVKVKGVKEMTDKEKSND
jgi:hypothetical protein